MGTFGILLEGREQAEVGGPGQRGRCFQPQRRVVVHPRAAVFSALAYISQWTTRALGGLPLCVLRRPSRFFPSSRGLTSHKPVRVGGGPG